MVHKKCACKTSVERLAPYHITERGITHGSTRKRQVYKAFELLACTHALACFHDESMHNAIYPQG
jgi:hypothetical protein